MKKSLTYLFAISALTEKVANIRLSTISFIVAGLFIGSAGASTILKIGNFNNLLPILGLTNLFNQVVAYILGIAFGILGITFRKLE